MFQTLDSKQGLSQGAVAGISLTMILITAGILSGIVFYIIWRRNKQKLPKSASKDNTLAIVLTDMPNDKSSHQKSSTSKRRKEEKKSISWKILLCWQTHSSGHSGSKVQQKNPSRSTNQCIDENPAYIPTSLAMDDADENPAYIASRPLKCYVQETPAYLTPSSVVDTANKISAYNGTSSAKDTGEENPAYVATNPVTAIDIVDENCAYIATSHALVKEEENTAYIATRHENDDLDNDYEAPCPIYEDTDDC